MELLLKKSYKHFLRIVISMVLITIVTCSFVYVPQVSAVSYISSGKLYKIKNVGSGKYLNVNQGLDINNTNVYQKIADDSKHAQIFRVVYDTTSSTYRIYPICSMNGNYRCLDIVKNGNQIVDGCNVQTYTPTDDIAQRFTITNTGNEKYKISSYSNSTCVIASIGLNDGTSSGTSSTSSGNVIVQKFAATNSNQLWYFEEYTVAQEGYYSNLSFRYPFQNTSIANRISSGYGFRLDPINGAVAFHNGIDMPAASGTALYFPFSGKVKNANFSSTLGYYVEIESVDKYAYGTTTKLIIRYCHLRDPALLSAGSTTYTIGTQIGCVGSTGKSTGPHLHYAIITNGSTPSSFNDTVNPMIVYPSSIFSY